MAEIHARQIEDLLRREGPLTAAALGQALGVSQPTISRQIASAGARIVRIGRARASRYALSRDIARAGSRWPLYRIDAEPRRGAGRTARPARRGYHFEPGLPLPAFLHGDFADGLFPGPPWFLDDQRPRVSWAAPSCAGWPATSARRMTCFAGRPTTSCWRCCAMARTNPVTWCSARTRCNAPCRQRLQRMPSRQQRACRVTRTRECRAGRRRRRLVRRRRATQVHRLARRRRRVSRGHRQVQRTDIHPGGTTLGRPVALRASRRSGAAGTRHRRCGQRIARSRWPRIPAIHALRPHARPGSTRSGVAGRAGCGVLRPWPHRLVEVRAATRRDGWLDADDAHALALRGWFGALIGNSDMHLGNVSLVLADTAARARPELRHAADGVASGIDRRSGSARSKSSRRYPNNARPGPRRRGWHWRSGDEGRRTRNCPPAASHRGRTAAQAGSGGRALALSRSATANPVRRGCRRASPARPHRAPGAARAGRRGSRCARCGNARPGARAVRSVWLYLRGRDRVREALRVVGLAVHRDHDHVAREPGGERGAVPDHFADRAAVPRDLQAQRIAEIVVVVRAFRILDREVGVAS